MYAKNQEMDVYIVEWASCDVESDAGDHFEIRAFGKTTKGKSVVLRINFYNYFFVKTPGWSPARQQLFLCDCLREYNTNESYSLPVRRKDAWGYSTSSENFVQLAFDTLRAQKIARSRLAKTMSTYEGSVDPVIRLCHVRNIAPTGWVNVGRSTPVLDAAFPRSDMELCVKFTDIHPCDRTDIPPLILCSWDLEVYSHNGNFPTPEIQENSIIQVACAFQKLDAAEPYRTVVVCLHDTDTVDGVEIISVATEKDLFTEWVKVLEDENVDIMVGWNTWGFDWKYVLGRVGVLTDDFGEASVDLSGLGRGPEGAGEARTWELNSGAYGQNTYTLVKMPGVLDLDLMQLVRRDHKLDSYSLNNVSKKFLGGQSKLDLPAYQIFEKFRGSASDRADIARYAVQDVLLPLKLFRRLHLYDTLSQMSIATCVPIDFLLSRGQQIKVFSLILKQARAMGYLLPDDKSVTIEGKYEGATVLEAKKGAHFDVVSGLDFASRTPFEFGDFRCHQK